MTTRQVQNKILNILFTNSDKNKTTTKLLQNKTSETSEIIKILPTVITSKNSDFNSIQKHLKLLQIFFKNNPNKTLLFITDNPTAYQNLFKNLIVKHVDPLLMYAQDLVEQKGTLDSLKPIIADCAVEAAQLDYSHILLLEQDTVYTNNLVEDLELEIEMVIAGHLTHEMYFVKHNKEVLFRRGSTFIETYIALYEDKLYKTLCDSIQEEVLTWIIDYN